MRNPRSSSVSLGLFVAALLFVGAVASADDPHYTVASRITIGGEGGWDILTCDAPGRRLFVSHSTHVVVVSLDGDSVVGDIPNTPGVHGVALAPDLGRGFTSNGRDSSVTVFDLKTLATLANVKLPARNPDAITYDPASQRVFTFNGGSANATALDAKTNQIVGSVPLGGRPEFAVVDGAGHLWVNLEDSSAVVELDTQKLQVLARWPLAPGEEPSGLALDRAHHRLFSACGNKMMVVLDATNGRRIATVPIGDGVDGAEYDETRGLVFSPNGEGTLTVIAADGPDKYRVVENAATERGARTMALDPTTGKVYLPTADFGPPPAPTADRPHPRPSIVPGSFRVLVVKP
jgi:DNA-binding beta-propeller fold protein YncE